MCPTLNLFFSRYRILRLRLMPKPPFAISCPALDASASFATSYIDMLGLRRQALTQPCLSGLPGRSVHPASTMDCETVLEAKQALEGNVNKGLISMASLLCLRHHGQCLRDVGLFSIRHQPVGCRLSVGLVSFGAVLDDRCSPYLSLKAHASDFMIYKSCTIVAYMCLKFRRI
jgi:hypothetical protein